MNMPGMVKGIPTLLIALFCIAFTGSAWGGVPTEVIVNKSVLINLKNPAERISIANPAIADLVLLSPTQFQLNGLALGSTSLIVWEKGGKNPAFFDIYVVGDLSQLESLIRDMAPNDTIKVDHAKDSILLSGRAANQETAYMAVLVAKSYAPNVVNNIKINDPQQVVLHVKVAQVDRTALRNIGISYVQKGKTAEGFMNLIGAPSSSSSSGGGTGGIAGNGPGLGSFSPLDIFTAGVSYFPGGVGAVIQALTTKGMAKILAEPNLLVKSGQKGEFLAGSKIPYAILQSTGGTSTVTIQFVDVGIKLNFAPVVQENGRIALEINPAEVSSIQGTLAVNGYPIIDIRTIKTFAELKDGESLVLAGLLSEQETKTMSKIPLLGDIPVLGALFRSTQKELEEKELVFFITPKIVKPLAPDAKFELPTDKSTAERERELNWVPLGK
jgi:pilus assembly protein CpaC